MSLTLYFHPFASYCQKALVGLYELEIHFEKRFVDLGKEEDRAALAKVWPLLKFPVLRDESKNVTVPEATLILEYLGGRLIPVDPAAARECRLRDRFFDNYVQGPMQKIVGDSLRPADKRDLFGVDEAKEQLRSAYGFIEGWMANRTWAAGDTFSMADCAAAPALLYADKVEPFGDHPSLRAYWKRLEARPSFARVLDEAKPYWELFPVK